jgi:hypothetical protein
MFRPPQLLLKFLVGFLFDPEDGNDVPPKRWAYLELNGVTTQRSALFIVTAVGTLNPGILLLSGKRLFIMTSRGDP